MFYILIRASMPGDAHWVYDDPSGVAEAPLTVQRSRAASRHRSSSPRRAPASLPSEWLALARHARPPPAHDPEAI